MLKGWERKEALPWSLQSKCFHDVAPSSAVLWLYVNSDVMGQMKGRDGDLPLAGMWLGRPWQGAEVVWDLDFLITNEVQSQRSVQ